MIPTASPLTDTATTALATKGIATAITGYGNSDRYREGTIDGISTEPFRDGRKGYCRIETANLRLRHEGEIEKT
jgi:hypothetical protein